MTKTICLLGFLLNAMLIHATTSSLCAVKRDASYAGFAQFSNDMEAYETFFSKTFSECASKSDDHLQMLVEDDTKTACALKRKEAYVGFTYLSQDMKLFEQIFQEKHPECAVEDIVTRQGHNINKRSTRRINLGNINTNIDNVQITNKRRRLVQRYSLCDLGTPTAYNGGAWGGGYKFYTGELNISANCSITSTITVRGSLKITGVGTVKPAIDGGWDRVTRSNTGVTLFLVREDNDELIIENMILTNGEREPGAECKSGGFCILDGQITILNSVVSSNSAQNQGGGFRVQGGKITISNSVVSSNSANEGGGFYILDGQITILNSVVSSNSAQNQGGGFRVQGGKITISNSVVSSNSANEGGGFYILDGQITILNSVVSSNSAQNQGGGFRVQGGKITISNNWWRFNPNSPDLVKYPFYQCPLPKTCQGGNNSRCIEGHAGPVCATCQEGYVLSGPKCVSCPGRKSASIFSGDFLIVVIVCTTIFGMTTYVVITQAAFTAHDAEDLRIRIQHYKRQNSGPLDITSFTRIVKIVSGLSNSQIQQAFRYVDENNDGIVEADEWNIFLRGDTASASVAPVEAIQHVQDEMNQMKEDTAKTNIAIGSWLTKLKIFVGFTQCLSYFPVTFDIPWTQSLLEFMKILEFTALDLYAAFGDLSCQMQTGYLQKFVYHMLLFPILLGTMGFVYIVARVFRCRKKYTNDSIKTQWITLLCFITFTIHTGMSTRIFRLFKCREVQGVWYLTADYTVQCRAGDWNRYAAVAVACIFLYVLGIPGVQWYVLYRNRKCLYERENMSHAEKEKQYKMQKQFGSIYSHYVPECYYYDILDLFRRLLLTGGLIMMGEESVAQVFMGIVICAGWLSLLIHKKPYEAAMDNILAVILAAHLLLSLVAGMALKLYELTPEQDVYQREGFGIVLLTVTSMCVFFFFFCMCVILGLASIVAGTPCIRGMLSRTCIKKNKKKEYLI
eukprot:g3884.t1